MFFTKCNCSFIFILFYLCHFLRAQNVSNRTANPILRNILNTNNFSSYTTNSTKFSTSTTAILSTTTLTTKPKPIYGLTELNLLNVTYDKYQNEFKINFKIQSNLTNSNNELLNYQISFNCAKEDNLWLGEVTGQFSDKNSLISSIGLLSKNKVNLPKPGSLTKCFSIAKSQTNNLTGYIDYLRGNYF